MEENFNEFVENETPTEEVVEEVLDLGVDIPEDEIVEEPIIVEEITEEPVEVEEVTEEE